jgi:diaminopimelate decarboxylase
MTVTLDADAGARPWWERPGLEARAGRLLVAGRDAEALARTHGTPLFVYDLDRVAENAARFLGALGGAGVPHRLRFAMKANPMPEFLAVLRGVGTPGGPGNVGIDACSPGEVARALEMGWLPGEISFTGTTSRSAISTPCWRPGRST